jgi:phage baseplate assembly protein gpV
LSALWLLGLSANAQDYTERVAPESPGNTFDEEALAALDKTPQAFQADEYYVLYNKGANMFFIAGNDWNTRASFNDKQAAVVYFTQTSAAKEKGEGVYELKNYVPQFSEFRSAFADGAESVWTDNNGQANRFWKVTSVGEDVRLSCVTQGDNLFLGYNPAKNDTRTYLLASGDIDWQLYSAPGWKEYEVAKEIYDKSEELRAAIDRAVENEIDQNVIMNAITVYENLESTIEEMDAQILLIMTALNGQIGEGATADDPIDVTELLVNPDYENNNNEGWSGDAPAFQSFTNAEFFNKNYTYYQTVKGARPGVYSVKVRAYYRPGSIEEAYQAFLIQNNRNAKVYAKTSAGEVRFPVVNQYAGGADNDLGYEGTVNINEEIYVPNNMQTAAAFFDEEINDNAANYDNTMYFILPEGEMNIGLQKKTQLSNDWTLFDSWSLNYYGNEADAYQMVFEKTKEAYELPDDQYVVSIPYLQAFETAAPASNAAADIVAALNALEEAYDTLTTNAQLWLDLDVVAKQAEAVGANMNLDYTYTGPLGEWAMNVMQLKGERQLTNDQIRALIAEKKAEIAVAMKHPSPTAKDLEMTDMLENPAFDTDSWNGWTVVVKNAGNSRVTQKCAEEWNAESFDIYQVVKDAPVGVYKISVQGFYRYGRGDDAYNAYNAQEVSYVKSSPTFVYLNEKTTPFMNVFAAPQTADFYDGLTDIYTAPDGNVFPDNMPSSARAFGAGMYTQEAMGLVREGQDLRIGVKGSSNQGGDSWVIFDNFKLTWVGYAVDIIQPLLEEQIAIYQEKLGEPMSKTAYNELSTALASANAAMGLDPSQPITGKQMFDALAGLFKVDSLVTASINKFSELADAKTKLEEAIGTYESTASANAITNATNLLSEIGLLMNAHSIEDTDVDNYVDKVDEAIAALRVEWVDPTLVSDDNPKDYTSAINNPNYDENNDGWKGQQAARNGDYGNAEIFDVRKYDYYQDLVNLQPGTYELRVQAFYRYGLPTMDYDSLQTEYSNNAYLYAAISPTDDGNYTYFATPLIRLAAEASDWTETADLDGYAYCATDTTFTPTGETDPETGVALQDTLVQYRYVANTMATASEVFLEEKYMNNSVIVKVPANGKLRIGLRKKGDQGKSWTLFDNWTLTYYGENSAKVATPIDLEQVVAVDNLAAEPSVLKREFFTIDGRRANSMQKGIMIMKTTLSNGSIVVRKIRK